MSNHAGSTAGDDPAQPSVAGTPDVLGKAEDIVRTSMLASLGVGIVPVPALDLLVLSGIQIQMLNRLAKLYDVEFTEQLGKSVIASLVGSGTSVVLASVTGWRLLFRLLPSPAWAATAISSAAFAGASTLAVGKVFIQHFESGGTMLTFQPDLMRKYYEDQLKRGHEEVQAKFAGVQP